ncbi:MAG: DUF4159 domain-containing protein [Planctomycetota bacterium]|nr:DUF4159 domain-containing protein [Planctomycetota bacterium]
MRTKKIRNPGRRPAVWLQSTIRNLFSRDHCDFIIRLIITVISICAVSEAASGQSAQTAPITDETIRASIARAVSFLYSRQKPDGSMPNRHSTEYIGGGEALSAFALLTAGQPDNEPKLRRTLEYLKNIQTGHTYTRSFRVIVFSRIKGNDYRSRIAEDVRWLIKHQHHNGGWGYGPDSVMMRLKPEWTDASNSQFALLALREAFEAGLPVPRNVWTKAELYWRNLQNKDGGWGYQPAIAGNEPQRGDSHGSMTTAGVASYFILSDIIGPQREQPFKPNKRRESGRLAMSAQIHRGLEWLGANYRIDKNPKYVWMTMPGQLYYYLFCLQRVGDAAGLRTIAGNDYDSQMCRLLTKQQKPNGSWNNSVIDTSFALLCLAKSSSPVIINRLELGNFPSHDPRDAANIARWMSRVSGRLLAWRQITDETPEEFPRSTLLYINGPKRSILPPKMAEKFKRFIRNGGTCLIQTLPGNKGMAESFQRYFLGLFPDFFGRDIGPDHPVFNLRFRIPDGDQPEIVGIGDECRTRIFILADDVSGAWHQNRRREYEHLFGLAGNIVLYSGGGKLPPGRFAIRRKPSTPPPAKRFINVARLKYAGDYNVCPLAIGRLGDTLAHSLPTGLKELTSADPAKPIDPSITLLWLTGNIPPKFSKAELTNIRKYLETGGTLLIDPAIGRSDFHEAAGKMLETMFGQDAVGPLKPDNPVISGNFAGGLGADLRKVRLIRRAGADAETISPKLRAAVLNKRIAVVLSDYGLTCSVEGNPCYENIGYRTDDARKIALNVILYAAARDR